MERAASRPVCGAMGEEPGCGRVAGALLKISEVAGCAALLDMYGAVGAPVKLELPSAGPCFLNTSEFRGSFPKVADPGVAPAKGPLVADALFDGAFC